ncbi:molybdopterin-dependent oxidoreductase [Dehalococcoidia bacterium]|nr:molybdopterin-dependent oxidoreductase [Dehalococcoidia bacterium]
MSGDPGTTVLELARESGSHIPTLCYDSRLNPYGACRICLVEDERSGALLASCVAPIAPGMVINTRSPKVLESRKTIVKLMLASHPDSCLVCDKGNRCELRQIAADLGVGLVGFQRIPQLAAIEEVNPFIERDLSKCILCARCIRADQELVVEGALDYINRGFSARPATLGDLPLEKSECTFCGTCVMLCPTGALAEKIKPYRGTATRVVSTICPFCGCGCNINLEVAGGQVVRARPSEVNSPNGVTLCVRGTYGYDFIHSPERLTQPLLKVDGEFKAVSWEEALDVAASRLGQIKATCGPDSLAVLGSSKCTNEENYLLQKFARAVLGTNNIDNGGRLYNSASRSVLGEVLGFPASTNPIEGIEGSEVILLIGTDPAVSAPLVSYSIKRAVRYKGAKLLVINPRETSLNSFAHLRLRPKAGTDDILINGLMRIIIDEELLGRVKSQESRVKSQGSGVRGGELSTINYQLSTAKDSRLQTPDYHSLEASLQRFTPEHVEDVCGVAAEDLRQAARLFAAANGASIVYGSGITQHLNGTENILSLVNLGMLTGNIGGRGGIYAIQRENNGQGASDMGSLPDFLPGYQSIGNDHARRTFEESWGVSLPTAPGLTALEMIEQAGEGKIKGMYIVGENPASSFPAPSLTREILSSLDFLVVQDLFLTETAKLAHLVLPAASFAEKDGTFTSFERRVQKTCRVIEPRGESLPDWQIIQALANKMQYDMPYSSPQGIMDEIRQLVPLYHGVDVGNSRQSAAGGMGDYRPSTIDYRWGTSRLYEGGFAPGFGHFRAVEYRSLIEVLEDDYPLELLIGSALYQFGSGARSSRSRRLKAMMPEPFIEINEADLAELGISPGEQVKLVSSVGEVASIARINNALSPGNLFMPISFAESPAHDLFVITLDPRSKSPALKSCRVRMERIEG